MSCTVCSPANGPLEKALAPLIICNSFSLVSHTCFYLQVFGVYYFGELNRKGLAKSVLNTDVDFFLVTVCSTFLQVFSVHITLSQLCWDCFIFFKGKQAFICMISTTAIKWVP